MVTDQFLVVLNIFFFVTCCATTEQVEKIRYDNLDRVGPIQRQVSAPSSINIIAFWGVSIFALSMLPLCSPRFLGDLTRHYCMPYFPISLFCRVERVFTINNGKNESKTSERKGNTFIPGDCGKTIL